MHHGNDILTRPIWNREQHMEIHEQELVGYLHRKASISPVLHRRGVLQSERHQ